MTIIFVLIGYIFWFYLGYKIGKSKSSKKFSISDIKMSYTQGFSHGRENIHEKMEDSNQEKNQ